MRYPTAKPFALSFLLASALTLTGCSSVPDKGDAYDSTLPGAAETLLANQNVTKKKIYTQHNSWKGTRYRLGGLNRSGIDCSGLVYTTFQEQFGLSLPRTTQQQVTLGKKVKREQLRPGDLIFFKTGINQRHVGIYIEDNKFLHASTTQGVTISKLDNRYWNQKYWHARRLEQ